MATTRANKNIADFKSKLIGGGARPNLFEVELTTLPPNVVSDWDAEVFSFMCKGANLPAQTIANKALSLIHILTLPTIYSV